MSEALVYIQSALASYNANPKRRKDDIPSITISLSEAVKIEEALKTASQAPDSVNGELLEAAKELRDNIGAASLVKNPEGKRIRDRIDAAISNAEKHPADGLEAMLGKVPENYRLYKIDASIEGRYVVMFTLKGQDREDWFTQGEVLDNTGKDVRPQLYLSGLGTTFTEAIAAALKEGE